MILVKRKGAPMAEHGTVVETKVKVAGVVSYIASAVLLAVLGAVSDANLVAALPDWLAVPLAAALPAAVTYWRAYAATHTARPDLDG